VNAIALIDELRSHGAELALDGSQLVVRGSGEPLPGHLLQELKEHRAELLITLGLSLDQTVASILASLRPHLSLALRGLPDSQLLALVNWNIITAWETAVRKANGYDRTASP